MMKTSIIQFLSTMGTAEPLHHPTGIFETNGQTHEQSSHFGNAPVTLRNDKISKFFRHKPLVPLQLPSLLCAVNSLRHSKRHLEGYQWFSY